jgi:hypothetical protein
VLLIRELLTRRKKKAPVQVKEVKKDKTILATDAPTTEAELAPLTFPYSPPAAAVQPDVVSPLVPKKEPNTIVLRPRLEGGIRFEYVESPQGKKRLYKPNKKRYYVMTNNMEPNKSGELVAYYPPQDLKNLPSRLRRALYNWESWGRSFGYQLTKTEKLTQALALIAFIIVAIVFLIVLYQG